jgi:hypothetical protein
MVAVAQCSMWHRRQGCGGVRSGRPEGYNIQARHHKNMMIYYRFIFPFVFPFALHALCFLFFYLTPGHMMCHMQVM